MPAALGRHRAIVGWRAQNAKTRDRYLSLHEDNKMIHHFNINNLRTRKIPSKLG